MIGSPATYTPSEIPSYRGNPFIEALPPIIDAKGITDFLRIHPVVDEEVLSLPAPLRSYEIQSRLEDFYEPFAESVRLFSMIDRLLRIGYRHRHPFAPQNAVRFEVDPGASLERSSLGKSGRRKQPPSGYGLSVVGFSGMGKTTTLDAILSYCPQVMHHSEYDGVKMPLTQVTWVKVEAPPKGSVKALALAFLEEIDKLAGTKYGLVKGLGLDRLIPVIANVAFHQGVGILVVDEVQALSRHRTPRGRIEVLDFLTSLKNTVGIPVVLVGTPASLPLIRSEFRETRRNSSVGDFYWERQSNDAAFDHFCETMWKFQFLANPIPYTKEIRKELYDASQGITDVVVKLFQESQIRVVANGSEQLSPKLLRTVMQEEFGHVCRVMKAIREREMSHLEGVVDLGSAAEAIMTDPDAASDSLAASEELLMADYEDAMRERFGARS